MYRNKNDKIKAKYNQNVNHNLGKKKDAILELRRMIERIDNQIRTRTQHYRYQNGTSKKLVVEVNKLKNIRYRLKGAYHRTFLANKRKWEAIRKEIQEEFEQANLLYSQSAPPV